MCVFLQKNLSEQSLKLGYVRGQYLYLDAVPGNALVGCVVLVK